MDKRYPIGMFEYKGEISKKDREQWIEDIAQLPGKLRNAVEHLSDDELNQPYREGGWTIRQVVHHIADSHMNAFIRFKLALTETSPTIKPYKEAEWANLPDVSSTPIGISLSLIEALHTRWVFLLRSDLDFSRTFIHPESESVNRLDYTIGMYAWHGNHHLAHILHR
ncbi:YfiT family bacillithiol transferase [Alkalihalobacterium bogoriense]|uniref:YfiT family bacillithiol transferase n=1 Tax=Alkalihalobacterium bogoriense TaxID=246272 RepID=UPI00047A7120|nr:putative metal-dependent hydrolase [Alkalihalobacterium bogoriense]